MLPTLVFLGFPGGSAGKESARNAGDLGSWDDPLEKGTASLQYSGPENSMDRRAWRATVHRVSKSQTRLSDFHFPLSLFMPQPLRLRS